MAAKRGDAAVCRRARAEHPVVGVVVHDSGAAWRIECDRYAADSFHVGAGAIACTCTFVPRASHL